MKTKGPKYIDELTEELHGEHLGDLIRRHGAAEILTRWNSHASLVAALDAALFALEFESTHLLKGYEAAYKPLRESARAALRDAKGTV